MPEYEPYPKSFDDNYYADDGYYDEYSDQPYEEGPVDKILGIAKGLIGAITRPRNIIIILVILAILYYIFFMIPINANMVVRNVDNQVVGSVSLEVLGPDNNPIQGPNYSLLKNTTYTIIVTSDEYKQLSSTCTPKGEDFISTALLPSYTCELEDKLIRDVDLTISSFSVSKQKVALTENFTIDFTVTNNSDEPAVFNFSRSGIFKNLVLPELDSDYIVQGNDSKEFSVKAQVPETYDADFSRKVKEKDVSGTLTIKGTRESIKSSFTLVPKPDVGFGSAVIDLGTVDAGDTEEKKINIENNSDYPVTLKFNYSDEPDISPSNSLRQNPKIYFREIRDITLAAKGESGDEVNKEILIFEPDICLVSDGEFSSVTISLNAVVEGFDLSKKYDINLRINRAEPKLEFNSPLIISKGTGTTPKTKTFKVEVEGQDVKTLQLSEVSGQCEIADAISIVPSVVDGIKKGGDVTIIVNLDPSRLVAGARNCRVLVRAITECDEVVEESLQISVS